MRVVYVVSSPDYGEEVRWTLSGNDECGEDLEKKYKEAWMRIFPETKTVNVEKVIFKDGEESG